MNNPTKTITASDVEESGSQVRGLYSGHTFTADASDLGWAPGQWPEFARTRLGNGQPFVRGAVTVDLYKHILSVKYVQQCGCLTLTVFND